MILNSNFDIKESDLFEVEACYDSAVGTIVWGEMINRVEKCIEQHGLDNVALINAIEQEVRVTVVWGVYVKSLEVEGYMRYFDIVARHPEPAVDRCLGKVTISHGNTK